ncbi:agip133 [Agrotis ipsilon multiple nucleopolyhedrovirus]|uniref:Occlusion-derived virus envelope protein ODV-E66 n=1 Tax=Agrotis ipsilon multiple nucleopolyhedrovirus TaxID=208013 RepID=B6D647_9ABAC|nr:agip133 [Agrotis ipsilon multiple nucleopolyhedrovirus]ACI28834.1 occlusion-derived virus envelope protein ODV-E66 [Agrotis ipsilon multiple nucleopolyhedrovirus]
MSIVFWIIIVAIAVIVVITMRRWKDDDDDDGDDDAGNNSDFNINDGYFDDIEANLETFELFFRSTIWQTRKLRSDYDDTAVGRQFDDDDDKIFKNLRPFEDANDFADTLKSLTTYAVHMSVAAVDINVQIATHLYRALHAIASRLPVPAPNQRLPWNFADEYWHVFSVALTECAMLLSIMMRPYIDVSDIAVKIIENYLPEPNLSLGWRRSIGFSTRMCLPYIYAQLCRGHDIADIAVESVVGNVLDEVKHHVLDTGDGIRTDFINFVDTNVRNYSFLVENYFTFAYYNFLFGRNFVETSNVRRSLQMVGSNTGRIHPALAHKNGAHLMPVLAEIMHYTNGVLSADFSKVVTVRNENYSASLVCPTNGVAYYQANYDFRSHALLWTMTKRIWSNNVYHARTLSALIDTGVLLLDADVIRLPGNDVLLSPNTSMSFLPNPGFSGIAATDDSAAVASFSKFDALNVEYYSYTLFHRTGMVQLYDNIKALSPLNRDAFCVLLAQKVLSGDDDDDDGNDDENIYDKNNTTWNVHSAQGCIVRHHDIANLHKRLPNFVQRTTNGVLHTCQPIPMHDINDGEGTVCYSMTTLPNSNAPHVSVLDSTRRTFRIEADEIECVFDFPFVVLKNNAWRVVTINNAYQVTKHLHMIHYDDIKKILGLVNLQIESLKSDTIQRTDYAFVYENTQTNQFKFYY